MLQKTTAKQVENLIEKFIEKFPTVFVLERTRTEEIEETITPLGMEHRRAQTVKRLARVIVTKYNGQIPDSKEELIALPGIGRYIANSVLCLAFGKETPLVDTNIVRVMKRAFDLKSEKVRARTDDKVWNFVKTLIPLGRSREVNLALLDFGALICMAKNPKCGICPVSHLCVYFNRMHITLD